MPTRRSYSGTVRRWRRRSADQPTELNELDPFLLAMVDRLAAARSDVRSGDGDWVAMDQVAALTSRMAEAAQATLAAGWDEDAERRALVERRTGPAGVEVRLTRQGRELLGPILGGRA
jgi:predicted RNA-binding Zn ribbon-like protein